MKLNKKGQQNRKKKYLNLKQDILIKKFIKNSQKIMKYYIKKITMKTIVMML